MKRKAMKKNKQRNVLTSMFSGQSLSDKRERRDKSSDQRTKKGKTAEREREREVKKKQREERQRSLCEGVNIISINHVNDRRGEN